MNPSIIRFHHFDSLESYCKLQEIFGSFDFKKNYEEISSPLNDFEITYYERDVFCENEDYTSLYLVKDFLEPGISNLSNYYFNNFRKEVYDKGLFSDELLGGFAKHYINKIKSFIRKIKRTEFIESKIMVKILNQLIDFKKLIEEYLENPYPEIKEKIQFNWIRADIEYLFYLLRENKEISLIADADLGRIIDSTIEFKKNDEYLTIKGSRKHLNDFRNSAARSTNNSNERLKKIFMNKDFYNH